MSTKYLKIFPYVKCDKDFGLPVLCVLGSIYSIWAADYFWLALRVIARVSPYTGTDYFMTGAIKNTHYVLSLTTAILLYIGFRDQNRKYIRQWYNLKVFESVIVGIGVILFVTKIRRYWPYVLCAIIILASGWYIICCTKESSKEIPLQEQTTLSEEVAKRIEELKSKECPPSYEEISEKRHMASEIKDRLENNADIDKMLRTWGHIKIFEFVCVVLALLLITMYKFDGFIYNHLNIIFVVLGICALLPFTIIFILNNMPTKKQVLDSQEEEILKNKLILKYEIRTLSEVS